MKTISVAPINEIEIKLTDKTYICSFNMLSMAYMQEELVKLDIDWEKLTQSNICQLVVYGGIKANHEEFTYEEAGFLVRALGPSNYNEIISLYQSSIMNSLDKEGNENLKKLSAQYIKKLRELTSI
mgnify:CR=1 FL=1